MKPYRLLRNNKETGPYSAEELITMGLKAYDLVWVDGKSAAWRYPCEIAELKPYAPEAEDLAAAIWKPLPSKEQITEQPVPAASPQAAPVPKPRIRVKADWRKVEENKESAPVKASEKSNPDVEDGVRKPQTQVTQPEAGAAGKPGAGTRKPESFVRVSSDKDGRLKDEKAAPQVKYSESLEDIKQRYNETVLQRKRPVLTARHGWLLLVPALCIGMWIGSGWTRDKQPKVAKQSVTETPEPEKPQAASLQSVMTDEADTQTENSAGTGSSVNNREHITATAKSGANTPVAAVHPTTEKVPVVSGPSEAKYPSATSSPSTSTSVKTVQHANTATALSQTAGTATGKHGAPITGTDGASSGKVNTAHPTIGGLSAHGAKEVAVNNQTKANAVPLQNSNGTTAQTTGKAVSSKEGQAVAAKDNNGLTETRSGDVSGAKQAAKTSPAVSLSKKQISDYVAVEEELKQLASGKEMKLHVKNITDIPVDLVVLDLQYYDGNGKFKKGETLYVNHLSANDAVALRAPTVRNAQRIDYKVSLLSIEKNGVYLIAE